MEATIRTINAEGLKEIRAFLSENHKKGDSFTDSMIRAWAADAEFQLAEGNPASIEIKSSDSVRGYTQEFTVSDAGMNTEIVEVDE